MNPLRRNTRHTWIRPLLFSCLLAVFSLFVFQSADAQSSASRKIKSRVEPQYPELARRNNISGSARVEVLIAQDGKIKNVKVLGGHPVLVQAAVAAVSKWRYEPASEESTAVIKFDFTP